MINVCGRYKQTGLVSHFVMVCDPGVSNFASAKQRVDAVDNKMTVAGQGELQ